MIPERKASSVTHSNIIGVEAAITEAHTDMRLLSAPPQALRRYEFITLHEYVMRVATSLPAEERKEGRVWGCSRPP